METLGRPTELTKAQLKLIKTAYENNISAPDVARHLGVTRQRVYYYFNKFKADGVKHQPKLTIDMFAEATA